MMKNFITVLFVGLFALSLSAQEKVAKIEFEQDVIDYGEVAMGSDGVRVFKFKNTGEVPLIISRVYSSCGCTIPKKPEEPVKPGETGEISVKYDTKRVGPIRKTITVYSNADTPTVAVKIKGRVLAEGESGSDESVLTKKAEGPVNN